MNSAVLHLAESQAPVGQIDLTGPLTAVVVASLALCVLLIILVVVLSRPRKRVTPVPRGAHSGGAQDKVAWRRRIDEVVERHASGALPREEAFAALAAVARDFASERSGRDYAAHTLADLRREDRNRSGGVDLLRMTVAALYPPEFADAAVHAHAREVTVEEAAGWVANLVERWGRR